MWFKRAKINSGISTIELVVTIAIFVLITAVILISYPQLSSQLALEKTTQDIASTLHETRMYGIGVRSFSATEVGGRTSGYGVHFSGDNKKSYILFSDVNNNRRYDEIEKSSEFKINGSEIIQDVCVGDATDDGTDSCVSTGFCLSNSESIQKVDILFARPAPSVFINGINDIASPCPGSSELEKTCARAVIVIKSPRGNCKKVEAWTTGQVSVKSGS